mmetsp:Transcript_29662/g.41341  ORF Transcript_29662/g.41341 Transcript_29662/m.41341 type:complete len:149 (+) Transcript_29662:163-609(+)|eukprot:CAMPEP_0185260396 /NCGR_PEP_ID=MMETSP1359-20130426/8992_1 /TAXON_ID=552665 /ORGANISM="Bigelowiella longifila, Strain CCMP242" /LENGTH=148 /DNA_ID=CAMNT_0027846633 /DNA_START=141 /DNA_END=587 /DNA_ORIENTATION=+
MEIKKYPALPEGFSEAVRIEDHSDLSTLTILIQDSVGGLQAFNIENDEWIDIPALPKVLVNSGDFLRDLSAGFIPSTRHRVVATPENRLDRTSCVFFVSPNWHSQIEPLCARSSSENLSQESAVARTISCENARYDFEPYLAGDRMPA